MGWGGQRGRQAAPGTVLPGLGGTEVRVPQLRSRSPWLAITLLPYRMAVPLAFTASQVEAGRGRAWLSRSQACHDRTELGLIPPRPLLTPSSS